MSPAFALDLNLWWRFMIAPDALPSDRRYVTWLLAGQLYNYAPRCYR